MAEPGQGRVVVVGEALDLGHIPALAALPVREVLLAQLEPKNPFLVGAVASRIEGLPRSATAGQSRYMPHQGRREMQRRLRQDRKASRGTT